MQAPGPRSTAHGIRTEDPEPRTQSQGTTKDKRPPARLTARPSACVEIAKSGNPEIGKPGSPEIWNLENSELWDPTHIQHGNSQKLKSVLPKMLAMYGLGGENTS